MSVVVCYGSVMPLNFVYCSKHIAVAADYICLPSPSQPMGGIRVDPGLGMMRGRAGEYLGALSS